MLTEWLYNQCLSLEGFTWCIVQCRLALSEPVEKSACGLGSPFVPYGPARTDHIWIALVWFWTLWVHVLLWLVVDADLVTK